MSSEKLNPLFYRLYLVSIWSLPERSLAAPKQVFAVFKPSSVPSVQGLPAPRGSEAGGDARIWQSSRKLNSFNLFSKKPAKANPLSCARSVKPMKQPSERECLLPRSTDCWLATDGPHRAQILQWTKLDCSCHEYSGQIFPLRLTGHQPLFRLVITLFGPSRLCSRRSYLCTNGGHC
jgi:hypothetical protein